MALNVIPGYDFGVNEVPNRETLIRQAKFVRISGIGLDQIDATLVGIKAGDTSGTTSASLPAPGWMWADPGGSLWIETDHGAVKLHRDGGGFESVRWAQSHAPEIVPPPPGSPFNVNPADAAANQTDGISLGAGASESISLWDQDFLDSAGGAITRNLMLNAETMPTGTTYPRLVGRGITLFHLNGTLSNIALTVRYPSAFRILTTNKAWQGAFTHQASNNPGGLDREHWYGIPIAAHSGTSLVSLVMRGNCYGWKVDQAIWGPGVSL